MTLAIPLAVAVGGLATWLLMRERVSSALHLRDYYRDKYRAAITPPVAQDVDEVWAEFLRDQWSR